MKKIEIKCKGAGELPLESLFDFQGKLKTISAKNLNRLKGRIIDQGFIAPFFIWDNDGDCKIMDGHQRLRALDALKKDGYELPSLFPVVYIYADNEEEARKNLLSISSQYGEFEFEEIVEWINDFDEELKESFRFVDEEIKFETDKKEVSFKADESTKKIKITINNDDYETLFSEICKVLTKYEAATIK